ncbi:hypothetical protein [Vitiosangium sp. GDMCC 1.1324]|uniref:hypothetical protein n=1 Tax=Vitiosangium sp. (strain GDMCC 1.1324) TaxID=2138576 RepID=UPI000D35A297|nr:hypothetical protein [Vitiosangium sp. GDMCC 1.1324]PTL76060.1 hypothetical protein DAT35_52015 [Vitiosangium sp. GDMCC 1.1324]
MVQASWRRVLVGISGAVLLGLGGCSSTRSSARVNEEWLARVPEAQLEGVRQAQLVQKKATDEVTRAKVAIQDAKHAQEIARRNEEAARAHKKASEVAMAGARSKGQSTDIAQAQEYVRRADQESSVAQAEVGFRDQAVSTLEALERMRARELAVADAELAQQQYLALQRSGDLRAQQLSGADFAKAVADAKSKAAEAQREVDAHLQKERLAQAQWQQLRDQTQGYGGSGTQGPSSVPQGPVK